MATSTCRLAPDVVVPAALGCLLRVYELMFLERPHHWSDALAPLLWSWLPFLLAAALSWLAGGRRAAIGFASACLLGSLYAHDVVFVAPSPGVDPALLLVLPLWSLLLLEPTGALVAWGLARVRRK